MADIKAGNCYRINRTDSELVEQFPELKAGCEFKAYRVENGGITALQVRGGRFINIKEEKDSWFWCFFSDDDSWRLDELEEMASDPINVVRDISSFGGRRISVALAAEAGQENNDGYEGNLMQAAAEYIDWLEKQLEFNAKSF